MGHTSLHDTRPITFRAGNGLSGRPFFVLGMIGVTQQTRRAMLRRQDGANPQAAQDLEWASEQVIGILVEDSEPIN